MAGLRPGPGRARHGGRRGRRRASAGAHRRRLGGGHRRRRGRRDDAGRPGRRGPRRRAVRRWLGLDADHAAAIAILADDPTIGPLVRARPALRVPGSVDPAELALRTVLGQQVSVAAARTLAGRLVALLGEPGPEGLRLFPRPSVIAAAGQDAVRAIGLTGRPRADRGGARRGAGRWAGPRAGRGPRRRGAALGALPGIGPWTVEYVALRAMRDLDAFPAHDLVLRRRMGDLDAAAAAAARRAVAAVARLRGPVPVGRGRRRWRDRAVRACAPPR